MIFMINKINETIIDSFKQYNPNLTMLDINNNILSYQNHAINLEEFNLATLFESYQLKRDFANLNATELFEIIQINSAIYNSNKE